MPNIKVMFRWRKEIKRKEVERKEVKWKKIEWICIFYRYVWMKGKENDFPLFICMEK